MADLDMGHEELGQVDGGDQEYSFLDMEEVPCGNFRLDPTRAFGTCKCGHPKSAHEIKGENKAAVMLSKLKDQNEAKRSVDSGTGLIEPGDKACNKFRLDPTATEFGMCKCGFKRADHVVASENKAKKALENLKASNEGKYAGGVGSFSGPCNEYRVDVAASEFGVCLCGYKKEDHKAKDENVAAKMLKNLKQKNEAKHKQEDEEALGLPTTDSERNGDDVQKLTSAEKEAEKKAKKKAAKCCIIS